MFAVRVLMMPPLTLGTTGSASAIQSVSCLVPASPMTF
jgi:hypothetical protein